MARRLGLSVLALGAGVAVLVSGVSASPHAESQGRGELRLMWGSEPGNLDPALATGPVGTWVLLNATCAKLFTTAYDPDTGKAGVVPEVAVDDPKITNGGRTYTFDLKRTFRFHTGEPVTAQSFAHAFNRDANPLLKSPAAGYLQEIIGADAVMQGKAATISGVQALGRYLLRIRLERRTGDFVARLTMPYFCPIPAGTPDDRLIALPDLPHGSGPYYLKERVVGRHIVLERNPYYRGGPPSKPHRIVWTIEPDWRVKRPATEQAKNDFAPMFDWPNAVVRDLVEKYGVDRRGAQVIRDSSTLSTFVFRFNTDRPAFEGSGQAPLRKAINYALDRPALTRAQGYLAARVSDRLLPAALRESSRRLYPLDRPNLVTARRLASRARYHPPTLTLYTASYGFSFRVAQEFARSLKPLDIKVDVKPFDLVTLARKLSTPGEPWDVACCPQGVGAAYPDPAGTLVPRLRGTKYEARMNAANELADAAARAKAWAKLEALLMLNDPPVAVYADFTPLAFVSLRNFGCWSGADARIDLGAVCKK